MSNTFMYRRKLTSGSLKIYAIVAVLLAAMWTLILTYAAFQKQQEIEATQNQLVYLNRAVAQHTEGLIRSVESNLHHIDLWLQGHAGIDPLEDAQFHTLITDIRQVSGGLIDPRMVSTEGRLYYVPARDRQPLADVSDRPYYREALKLAPGEIYIADPVLSRVTGKWGIPISMRLSRPVGGMAVVFAAIEVNRLQAVHDTYRIPSGSLLLLRTDGVLLTRAPFDAKVMGINFSHESWFATMLTQGHGFLTVTAKNTDQRPKLFAYERLTKYPVIVAVSQGLEDALGTLHQRQQVIFGGAAFLTLLVLAFSWRLDRAQRAMHLLQLQAQTARAELVAAQQALPLGLFRADTGGKLLEVNTAWRRIHGLSDEAALQGWHRLLDPALAAIPAQSYLPQGEHVLHLPDGQRRQIRVKRAPIMVDGQIEGSSGVVEDVTDLLASQRAQQMLVDVFEHSTDLVIQSTATPGRFVYLNPAIREFLGLAASVPPSDINPDDLLGASYLEHRAKEIVPIALQQGYWQGETVLNDRHGKEHIFSHLLIAHRDSDGELNYFSGIMRDITAFKNAIRDALHNERRLQAMADNVPALLAEIDANYVYRFANQAYQDILGIPPNSMIGRTVREIMGEQVYQEIGPHHAASFRGERVRYIRETVRNGRNQILSVVLGPRLADDGQPDGCYAIAFDVSELHQTAIALRQSEQRLLTLTDRLPMRVAVIDEQQRFRFVNRAYESVFARPRATMLGCTVHEVLGDAPYAVAQPYLLRALNGEVVSYDGEYTGTEGYSCHRAEYLPQFAEDGQGVVGVVAITTDTTGQKREERRLLALSQHDTLTGLLNRAGFEGRLRDVLVRSEATQGWVGLMYLDIDYFKQVNDREGHLVGDMLLQGFGGRLNKIVRATDVVARLGGDEFVILLSELDSPASAAKVAENILAAMHLPFVLETRSLAISTSIGVALHDGRGTMTARKLVQCADEQLYAAKGAGRNCFILAEAVSPGNI